jgi:hypothetical protein
MLFLPNNLICQFWDKVYILRNINCKQDVPLRYCLVVMTAGITLEIIFFSRPSQVAMIKMNPCAGEMGKQLCTSIVCQHLHCHLSIFTSEYFKCDYFLMLDGQLWYWLGWWKGCVLIASRQARPPSTYMALAERMLQNSITLRNWTPHCFTGSYSYLLDTLIHFPRHTFPCGYNFHQENSCQHDAM